MKLRLEGPIIYQNEGTRLAYKFLYASHFGCIIFFLKKKALVMCR